MKLGRCFQCGRWRILSYTFTNYTSKPSWRRYDVPVCGSCYSRHATGQPALTKAQVEAACAAHKPQD